MRVVVVPILVEVPVDATFRDVRSSYWLSPVQSSDRVGGLAALLGRLVGAVREWDDETPVDEGTQRGPRFRIGCG